jgi:hypothetical protein
VQIYAIFHQNNASSRRLNVENLKLENPHKETNKQKHPHIKFSPLAILLRRTNIAIKKLSSKTINDEMLK